MTREEEIDNALVAYSNETEFDGCDYIGEVAKEKAFIAGAKWADKHPYNPSIKWMTDTPIDVKYYFVQIQRGNNYFFNIDHWNGSYWHLHVGEVVAWSDLSNIKPYRREE